jgi:hypothetical protein
MISGILKTILDNVVLPAALTAAGTAIPLFGILLSIPFIGPLIKKGVQAVVDNLFDKGAIEIKDALIDKLSDEAKIKYAPEIAILREAQTHDELTPAQEAEYAKRLQDIVRNRPDIVRG